jgi:hypothetical protein
VTRLSVRSRRHPAAAIEAQRSPTAPTRLTADSPTRLPSLTRATAERKYPARPAPRGWAPMGSRRAAPARTAPARSGSESKGPRRAGPARQGPARSGSQAKRPRRSGGSQREPTPAACRPGAAQPSPSTATERSPQPRRRRRDPQSLRRPPRGRARRACGRGAQPSRGDRVSSRRPLHAGPYTLRSRASPAPAWLGSLLGDQVPLPGMTAVCTSSAASFMVRRRVHDAFTDAIDVQALVANEAMAGRVLNRHPRPRTASRQRSISCDSLRYHGIRRFRRLAGTRGPSRRGASQRVLRSRRARPGRVAPRPALRFLHGQAARHDRLRSGSARSAAR